MTGTGQTQERCATRRPKAQEKRARTIRFSLTDAEYETVSAAAADAGLACGAYADRLVLAAARGTTGPADEPLREVLRELIRASGLVRRIGVNLNQSVAKLNATGQRSGDLLPYARESLRRADHLTRSQKRSAGGCDDRGQHYHP